MRPRQPLSWSAFLISCVVGISLFCIPAFIIRPFRHQGTTALSIAMAIRQWAPLGTLLALLLCLIFAFVLWQGDNLRRKIVLGVFLVLVAVSTAMSRANYFEWMFHPIDSPQFDSESASKLDPAEMILAVRFGADARAYPISEMAYHHVLNDVIAGIPIVVTY